MVTPTHIAPHTDEPTLRMQQALSAWMDGEPLPEGITVDALIDWAATEDQGQVAWNAYHVLDDVMQNGLGYQAPVASADNAVGSAAWHAALASQLAQTTVACTQEDVLQPKAVAVQPQVVVAPSKITPKQEAANAPRWQWAAGFASVAAVGVLSWSMLGGGSPTPATPQTVAPSVVAQVETSTPAVVAPVATTAKSKDPAMQAMLVAHAQLGGMTLLGDSVGDVE